MKKHIIETKCMTCGWLLSDEFVVNPETYKNIRKVVGSHWDKKSCDGARKPGGHIISNYLAIDGYAQD